MRVLPPPRKGSTVLAILHRRRPGRSSQSSKYRRLASPSTQPSGQTLWPGYIHLGVAKEIVRPCAIRTTLIACSATNRSTTTAATTSTPKATPTEPTPWREAAIWGAKNAGRENWRLHDGLPVRLLGLGHLCLRGWDCVDGIRNGAGELPRAIRAVCRKPDAVLKQEVLLLDLDHRVGRVGRVGEISRLDGVNRGSPAYPTVGVIEPVSTRAVVGMLALSRASAASEVPGTDERTA